MEINKNNHGLSLIEIVVTVAIIAVLATITIGIVSHMDSQNNQRSVESTFALLDGALDGYYEYWKGFPDPNLAPYLTHSAALYGQLRQTPGVNEYLDKINNKLIKNNPDVPATDNPQPQIYDPWGTLLDYSYVPGNTFPKISSAGPDKSFKTSDDIQNK